ncbi:MAG TPA: hypothetical protein VJH63_01350 [Candidatus Paceibacterota bacterium]
METKKERIEVKHNPDHLTDKQIGIKEGWRLLSEEELNSIPALPKNDESIEEWDGRKWDLVSTLHHDESRTYRTKRP